MAPLASTSPATSSCLLVLLLHSILLGLLSPSVTALLDQVMLDTQTLNVGESLYHLERDYEFRMQRDCNMALHAGNQLIWETHTRGEGTDCRLKFQPIDNQLSLVVWSPHQNKVIWQQPENWLPKPSCVLVVQPDRNVVIYTEVTWSTETSVGIVTHLNGDQSLIPGSTLLDGEYLIERQHNYKFILKDCNLVLYDDASAIWQTNTKGAGTNCSALINYPGNLLILDYQGHIVWKSPIRPSPGDYHALVLQPDRNVVVYTKPVWSTNTAIPTRVANLSSGNEEEDGGLPAGRKAMIHMVTNKRAA